MKEVSEKQRDILQHALGIRPGRREYRNHFVTGPGSDDYSDCESLVAAGLMTKRPGNPLTGGDPVFHVTDAGRVVAVEQTTARRAGNRAAAEQAKKAKHDSGASNG
jgi:hypothetical protein